MRKVTASAVILTALTGCSQSSVPNNQWSFEVPTDDHSFTDAAEATLVSEGAARSLSAGLPEEAQSFADYTDSGRIMGPAFEQPSAETPLGARISTASSPKDVSALAAEAYGVASGLSTQTSTRPDPVAQVRAYLRSSGSPSALTNRTPYTSKVFLSSLPTPNRYYEPSIPSVDTAFPIGNSGLGIPDSGITDLIPAPLASGTGIASTGPLSTDSISTGAVSTNTAPAIAVSTFPSQLPASLANEPAPAVTFTANRFEDELPQLGASLPASALSSGASPSSTPAPVASSAAPVQSLTETATPIGTAILQNLRVQEAESVTGLDAADEGLPNLVSNRYQSNRYQSSGRQVSDATDASLASSVSVLGDNYAGDYAYAPSSSAQPLPSLKRLTETMPDREISPLVDSFRSTYSVSPAAESSLLDNVPAAESNLEASARTDDDISSYLPSSVRADDSEPTVYVPIAEDSPQSSSILLIDAADTLNPAVSTADFLSELAARNAFSSVVSSDAFAVGEPLTTLTGLRSQDGKTQAKQSTLKAAHRSKAVALAARQASQRRQRLIWM